MFRSLQFEQQYIDCGDAKIACYIWGTGEPLVLLHGNGENSQYFEKCIPYLSHFYRVIAIDSRAHGQSERGTAKLNFDQMAEDLRKVFDYLSLKRAHLLGFSDGGNIAIKFALLYPQYVDHLILNGANVSILGGLMPWVQIPVYPAVGFLTMLSPLGQKIRNKRDILLLMAHGYGVRLHDLQLIEHPTLLLVGNHDMIRAEHTIAMTKELPNSQLAILEGSHFIAAESPARFSLNCLRFLRDEPVPDAVDIAWKVQEKKMNL